MEHTMEEDFQHFLSYSGFSNDPPETIEKMRNAYSANWTPKQRTCCFIPNQSRLDLGCRNLATYEIWFGNQPGPEDYSDACAEHLEQMLDDHTEFKVFRISDPVKKDE